MLSAQEYLVSWGMYLLGAVGLMVVWWRMTSRIRPAVLRNLLRVSAVAALFMPYPVPEQEAFLAPAFMMTFVEGLFMENYGFSHAGTPLLVVILMANALYLVLDLSLQLWRRRRQTDRADEEMAS